MLTTKLQHKCLIRLACLETEFLSKGFSKSACFIIAFSCASVQKSLKFANIGNESHVDEKWTEFSKQPARTNYLLAKRLQES